MKNKPIICTALALTLVVFSDCAGTQSTDKSEPLISGNSNASSASTAPISTQPRTPMKADLVSANNRFGFDLFGKLRQSDRDQNLFLSPISITMALTMTYNGAAGETEMEMARTLKLDGMSLEEINQRTADLLKSLKSADPKIELSVANSIWTRKGIQFKKDFLSRNRQFFGAAITSLDFANPDALTKINGWVNTSTKGKIDQILDQISREHVMFLINAVYFKGKWQQPFDKKLTQDKPFHLPDGKTKTLPMMSQSGDYRYLRGEKFQAVSLPYGKGSVNIYLFLPDQNSSLNDFLNDLSYEKWEQWMSSFDIAPGDVWIPRFKLDYDKKLNDSLQSLGMKSAFAPDQADFSGMDPESGLYIDEVKHRAVVEVNEEGTEAAAATAVLFLAGSVTQRFTFIADRPFLMAIADQKTNAILFLGAVLEPK